MEQGFAYAAAALIGVVIIFQLALMLGAPWGHLAWGGRNEGVLPTRLRVGSGVAVLLLGLMAWVVLAAGSVVDISTLPESWLDVSVWVIVGYFVIGTLANLASRSRPERWWAVVSFAIAVFVALVGVA